MSTSTATMEHPAILATKFGRNHRADMEKLGDYSNSGRAWRNSSDSFRGQPLAPGEHIGTGQMSGHELDEFLTHLHAGRVEYVIRSYNTPIAYLVRNAPGYASFWVQPDTGYSNTTRGHKGRLYVITMERHGYHGPDAYKG
jgi:hypothetical protein